MLGDWTWLLFAVIAAYAPQGPRDDRRAWEDTPSRPEASASGGDDWRRERDEAMARVERNAGAEFHEAAMSFVLGYLSDHDMTAGAAGEVITAACKAAEIIPHDDRAFGPVYMKLMRRGQIEKCGVTPRLRGHGTTGGNVWRLKVRRDQQDSAAPPPTPTA